MSNIYMHISAGSGPKECQWAATKLAAIFCKEAKRENLKCEILLDEGNDKEVLASLLLKISGVAAKQFSDQRTGTIQWIGQSPYRKNHKRRNWFVGVTAFSQDDTAVDFKKSDIEYQTMKASGPGGQHVNATQSAVRATHIPTGISVVAREERSQHANKRLTRIKLAMIFANQQSEKEGEAKQNMWRQNHNLERGNPVRIYEGTKFKLKT